MKTQIFKDYSEFENREDKSLNGVTPKFASDNPGYEADNATNDGCFDCEGCTKCSGCMYCSSCTDCADCMGCKNCKNCADCVDCEDCKNCCECIDYTDADFVAPGVGVGMKVFLYATEFGTAILENDNSNQFSGVPENWVLLSSEEVWFDVSKEEIKNAVEKAKAGKVSELNEKAAKLEQQGGEK